MATHTIVTIAGSLRKESFSLKIAKALAKLAPASPARCLRSMSPRVTR